MKKLSVVVITRNEEANLSRCLKSVAWADELVVVDSGSTDRTIEIAEGFGARVIKIEWRGFGLSKQTGLDQAEGEWVLSIDADEEVPAGLADEIKTVIGEEREAVGYLMPRRTRFLGRWILHGGWYPDHILRLFKRARGRFTDASVHEGVVVDGPVARLTQDLLHYSYPTLEAYLSKFNLYTTLAATDALKRGRNAGVVRIVLSPVAKFIKQYILKAGFLDGTEGLVLAFLSAGYVLTKYAKLRELKRKELRES